MLNYFFAFLPLAVCIVGTVAFLLKSGKGYAQTVFTILLVVITLYYLTEGFYLLREVNYNQLVYIDLLSDFVSSALPVLLLFYIRAANRDLINEFRAALYLIPALVTGSGAVIIYSILGFDQTVEMYKAIDMGTFDQLTHPVYHIAYFWTHNVYWGILVVEMIILCLFLAVKSKEYKASIKGFNGFFFRNEPYPVTNVIFGLISLFLMVCFVRITMGRSFLLVHPVISAISSCVTAFLLVLIIGFAYIPKVYDLTMAQVMTGRVDIAPDPHRLLTKRLTPEEMKTYPIDKMSLHIDAERLYMFLVNDRYYANPDASLKDASSRLGMTKRRINVVCLTYCSCTFEQLLAYCASNLHSED